MLSFALGTQIRDRFGLPQFIRDLALPSRLNIIETLHSFFSHLLCLETVLIRYYFQFFLRIDFKYWCDISQMVWVGCIKNFVLLICCKSSNSIVKVSQEDSCVLHCLN